MKVPEPPSKTVFLRIMVPGTPVQRAPALAADGFQSVFGATQVTRQRRWGPALGVTGGAEWAPPAYGIRLRGGPGVTIFPTSLSFSSPYGVPWPACIRSLFPGPFPRGEMPFPQHGFCTSRVPSSPPLRFGGAAPGLECPPGRKGLGAPGILAVARRPAEKSVLSQATDRIQRGRYIIIYSRLG